ncbi:hypothetical protein BSKO_04191 [Bryopsis sp. KO-2023]|nr:hypothetical protein BSKO_04191 [Bryopsis sp. KO-2023]
MSFQIDIADESTWSSEIMETPGTVQVVEGYQSWCGPCKAVQSAFKRLYFDLGDRPLKFYTVKADRVQALASHKGKCRPVFFFYKDGQVLETVEGVDAPRLTKLIMDLSAAA